MGFRVETSEMKQEIEEIKSTSKKIQSQITASKNAFKEISSSTALEGKVKTAINQEINNCINTLNTGMIDCYKLLDHEAQSMYESFKSTTGEQSDNAILDEDILNKGKTKIKQFQTQHQQIVKTISQQYESISDLIQLETPKNTFNESCVQAYQHLDKIIQKVNTFNNEAHQDNIENLSNTLQQYISAMENVSDLGYLNEDFQHFIKDKTMLHQIQNIDSQIKQAEKAAKRQKERLLKAHQDSYRSQHPVLAHLKDMSESVGDTWSDIMNGITNISQKNMKHILSPLSQAISPIGSQMSHAALGLMKSTKDMLQDPYVSAFLSEGIDKKLSQGFEDMSEGVQNLLPKMQQYMDNHLKINEQYAKNYGQSLRRSYQVLQHSVPVLKGASKFVSPTLTAWDIKQDLDDGKNMGQAVTHTGVNLAVGKLAQNVGKLASKKVSSKLLSKVLPYSSVVFALGWVSEQYNKKGSFVQKTIDHAGDAINSYEKNLDKNSKKAQKSVNKSKIDKKILDTYNQHAYNQNYVNGYNQK